MKKEVNVSEAKEEVIEEEEEFQKSARQKQTIDLDELQNCGLIGRGASGHVIQAKHKETNQLFAIKIVNNVHDKAKRNQMLTEIQTLYSVESPW